MLDLRQVGLDSAAELSRLCSSSFVQAYSGVDSDEDIQAYCKENYSVSNIKANLSRSDVIYKVAYRDAKAVGFFMLQDHHCPIQPDESAIELKQVYVLASEYGSGLGQQLLDEIILYSRQQKKCWLWLCVSDANLRAIAFYEKHRFEQIGVAAPLEVGGSLLPASIMRIAL